MQQVLLENPGRFAARSVQAGEPAPGEALLQVARVGLCGSDFHAFFGRHPAYTYPRVLGHEISGVILAVPANDRGLEVGDRCAVDPYLACGNCKMCHAGRTNCCEVLQLFGIHTDGGMQELLSVPLHLLHKSSRLSLDELALVETLGIGAHAVSRAGIGPGDRVLVIGAGPIGISAAIFARAAGAGVQVIEKKSWRRSLVENQGIAASDRTTGELADVVLDATGSARSMSESLHCVAAGGKLVFVGLTSDLILLDDALFHRREITLLASRNSAHQFPRIIRLLEEGKIQVGGWVTDRMSLEQVPTEFAKLPAREHLMKAMVDVSAAEADAGMKL
jgi:2-desacetyl-2-hydroxyethyl bacteriochlorophyllide A dehydrogenase